MGRAFIYLVLMFILAACDGQHEETTNFYPPVVAKDSVRKESPVKEAPQMGMVFDDVKYNKIAKKKTLKSTSYANLPSSVSLKDFCPRVASQKMGTCVGWSTAYYARTILYAQQLGIVGQEDITEKAFSPGFIYRATSQKLGVIDYDCERGSDISEALRIIKTKGVVFFNEFPDECYQGEIPSSSFQNANKYRIKAFYRLSDPSESKSLELNKIKKALTEGSPVVIGIETRLSFMDCSSALWTPKGNESSLGGHALCIVGYNDNVYGGAFHIVNSWGKEWGEDGFVWVKYEDYFNCRRYAFEVSGDLAETVESNPIDIEMVHVKGGTFKMGCTYEQGNDCMDNESPTHNVTIGDFYIGKYEVTQAQWKAVMGRNPSYRKGCDNCPVEMITMYDIQKFIKELNKLTKKKYRLPTEAEWEYAARGGNKSKGYKYAGSNNLDNVSWYDFKGDGSGRTHPVGKKAPNELGIFDMSGNVWEDCSDWYGEYTSTDKNNPKGHSTSSYFVTRGGSWFNDPHRCRVSHRSKSSYDNFGNESGFRLAR